MCSCSRAFCQLTPPSDCYVSPDDVSRGKRDLTAHPGDISDPGRPGAAVQSAALLLLLLPVRLPVHAVQRQPGGLRDLLPAEPPPPHVCVCDGCADELCGGQHGVLPQTSGGPAERGPLSAGDPACVHV